MYCQQSFNLLNKGFLLKKQTYISFIFDDSFINGRIVKLITIIQTNEKIQNLNIRPCSCCGFY